MAMGLPLSMYSAAALCVALALSTPGTADAKGFLGERAHGGQVDAAAFRKGVEDATSMALDFGGNASKAKMESIRKVLLPMWRALPKNGGGRVERRLLRYLAHRYFAQTSLLVVRGFEASRPLNRSSWGPEDILSQSVPAYVEKVLEAQHRQEHGFDLEDAVALVAILERLVFEDESSLVKKVYHEQHQPLDQPLSQEFLQQILEEYVLHWITDGLLEGEHEHVPHSELALMVPKWEEVTEYVHGQVEGLKFQRQRSPGQNGLKQDFSLEDTHRIVGDITRSFGHFWRSECTSMKEKLMAMDTTRSGRIPLAKFHGSGLNLENWQFVESEAYLRELGALEETSSWYGKQVIISNYMQGASNCIVSSQHYHVCCPRECEGLLGEIEAGINAPLATPEEILALVGNMSAPLSLDDDSDVSRHLKGELAQRLHKIAVAHGGKVPLHGRLFSQWLHYVFPYDCPFPHKTGTTTAASPAEYGKAFIASEEEMRQNAAATPNVTQSVTQSEARGEEELGWMSQWSQEEELISDYEDLRPPGQPSWAARLGSALFLLAAIAGVVGVGDRKDSVGMAVTDKSHLV